MICSTYIDEKMQYTIELARIALKKGEAPIAATIYLSDELITEAYATEKEEKRFLVHAEQKALIEADKLCYSFPKRKQMQLFTTLEPCMMCYGCALSSYIGKIYFSLKAPDDGITSIIGLNKIEIPFIQRQMPKMYGGILAEEVKHLFINHLPKLRPGRYKDYLQGVIDGN